MSVRRSWPPSGSAPRQARDHPGAPEVVEAQAVRLVRIDADRVRRPPCLVRDARAIGRKHGAPLWQVVARELDRLTVGQKLDVNLPRTGERTRSSNEREHPAVG